MRGNHQLACMVSVLLATLPRHIHPQCLTENDSLDIPPSNDLSPITDFGLQLFKEVFPYDSTTSNFFFSPYSIWNALTLAYFGSGGQTEAELEEVLRLEGKVATLKMWRTLEFLYNVRQANKSGYIFNLANRAYFDETVTLRPCVSDILTSELSRLDFQDPVSAADQINEFVSNTTKGAISTLVNPRDVSNAQMVLVNAAYFKGTWLYQFKKSKTTKRLFYVSTEQYTFVDMMRQKGNFRFGISEELGCHILELPYTGEAVSMYVLLPPFITGEHGFNSLVSKVNGSLLHSAFDSMWRLQVEVVIPKFKMEQTLENELMQSLSHMGINELFDQGRANLTTFSQSSGLSIGKSIHKAALEVSEEGTEAAASTVLISFRAARPAAPEKFECNHPFLFIIYDNAARNILFMGAYKNPKA